MTHPTFAELIDYLHQRLSVNDGKTIGDHIATCVDCQHTLEIAQHTVGQPHQENLVAPPADLVRQVVAAFRRRQNQAAHRLQTAAALQFDNFAQVAALGARGIVRERQLLYSFDEFDLDLQIGIADSPNTLLMRGQLLAQAPLEAGLAGITVQLIRDRNRPWLRLTDETGSFNFSRLHAGEYSLQILLEARDVRIEPLVLPG